MWLLLDASWPSMSRIAYAGRTKASYYYMFDHRMQSATIILDATDASWTSVTTRNYASRTKASVYYRGWSTWQPIPLFYLMPNMRHKCPQRVETIQVAQNRFYFRLYQIMDFADFRFDSPYTIWTSATRKIYASPTKRQFISSWNTWPNSTWRLICVLNVCNDDKLGTLVMHLSSQVVAQNENGNSLYS